MSKSKYRFASPILLRSAGVPIEVLETLATPAITAAARGLIAARKSVVGAKAEIEQEFAARKDGIPRAQARYWRKAIRSGAIPQDIKVREDLTERCSRHLKDLASSEVTLQENLRRELASKRSSLFSTASNYLPAYLIFAAAGVRERVVKQLLSPIPSFASRNKQDRADERHLILYLQRIAAKNDSLSEFGPASWGKVDSGTSSLHLDPVPGIMQREVFLERWTAHGIAAAINADREALEEIAPRPNPEGRIENSSFVFTNGDGTCPLNPETVKLLRLLDGRRPAFSLGDQTKALQPLVEKGMILWKLEVPALEARAFDRLLADISGWRDNEARARWLSYLQPIRLLAETFAQTQDSASRLTLIKEVEERLENLGTEKTANRFLYSATNPIGEECVRVSNFTISENLIDEVTTDAEPWIDLWRDNYAFVASRVAAGLRQVFEQSSNRSSALPLPEFLRCCRDAQMPLEGAGMVALAHLAFREVRTAFADQLRDRAHFPSVELSADDCHFVRQNFGYSKFDECTYPSADLQLAASSVEAVQQGEYQWVLAELHPPIALLHHGFYWSCPDKAALSAAIEQTLFGKPYLYYGYFAADFTATTTVRLDAFPKSTKFVAPQRSIGDWQTFHPAETEVFVDQEGDVGVRVRTTHEYLGSFARGWVIPLGFHPFYFSLGRHSPRLLCGKVVVQRESWTVTLEELGAGDFTGISRDLVIAVEKLRAARNLPRHVFIRPTEQALRRSGVEGRDKDTKPVYIDFESYLFLEVFHRWLKKAGELEITEMLPRPDQLLWSEADGHHTFELRTQIIPR